MQLRRPGVAKSFFLCGKLTLVFPGVNGTCIIEESSLRGMVGAQLLVLCALQRPEPCNMRGLMSSLDMGARLFGLTELKWVHDRMRV